MKAFLKNHNQAPRKVRLVTDLVKGKSVSEALEMLPFVKKKGADEVKKLIASAAANSGEKNTDALVIENITVDKGMTLKRWLPRARGRATPLRKEKSHIKVTLKKK
ncbi:MAG: 50S ribosomal protein L22 [Patescibacteria group bacterium UBA2103]